MLKYTDVDHSDRESIAEALDKVEEVVSIVNKKKREFESLEQIREIQESISWPAQMQRKLVEPGRRLISEVFFNLFTFIFYFFIFSFFFFLKKGNNSKNIKRKSSRTPFLSI